MNILQRMSAKTPKFYRILRNIALALGAAGGVLAAAPLGLPAAVVTVGGYLATAGAVASAVAQTATEADDGNKQVKQ